MKHQKLEKLFHRVCVCVLTYTYFISKDYYQA